MMIISHIYWLALPLLFRHVFSTWHVDYMLGWFPFLFISFHFTSLCFVCCVLLLLLCVRKDFMVVYNIIIGEWHTCFIRIYPNACGYFRIEKKICSVLVVENMTYPRGKSYLCTREKLLNAKQWQKQQQLLVAREPKLWREGAWNSKSGGKNMVIENISRSHIPVVCMHRQIYKCMYIVYKIYLYSIKVVPKWTQSFRCPPFMCRRRCASTQNHSRCTVQHKCITENRAKTIEKYGSRIKEMRLCGFARYWNCVNKTSSRNNMWEAVSAISIFGTQNENKRNQRRRRIDVRWL